MGRKKILERRQKRLEERKQKLIERSEKSQDVGEVREINSQMQDIAEELRDIADEIEAINGEGKKEGEDGSQEEGKEGKEDKDNERGMHKEKGNEFDPSQAFRAASFTMGKNKQEERDEYNTEEYRKAFMNFVCRGTPIPENMRGEMPKEFRDAQVTLSTDASAVIPTNLMDEIIIKMETYGNIWNKVRKLNVQGGIKIPMLSLKPVASWIGEDEVSDSQKLNADDAISFSYYGLECRIYQTILANVVTLKSFQSLFVTLSVEAMVKACEMAIFNGRGQSSPLGIANDTRIPGENVIMLSKEEVTKWDIWKKKVFAKMKKSYRKGDFWMNQATFDGYIDGMVDGQGQPIGRVNYGIEGEEKYRFGGKTVETVEDELLKDYESAADGDIIAIFGDLSNYVFNTNMQMVTIRWTDHDTNQVKDKAMLIADGKLADPYGMLIIKKGSDTAATKGK